MDVEEGISDSLPAEQCAANDDKYLCSFYYRAIKRLLDIDNKANASYLHRYFKIYNEYFDFWCRVRLNLEVHDDNIVNLLKDSLYFRIGVVYKTATLLSSAVAFHYRNIYKKSPDNIDRLVSKKLVRICSLGRCAVSDIVAIVTVLDSIALKKGVELDFRVTIIESDERWKITCLTILSGLAQFFRATWKITFIHAKLADDNVWTSETCKYIQEADVVTMTTFLSKFYYQKKNIIKMICDLLQPKAMLFILDHPLKELLELSFDVTVSDNLELVHQVFHDFHPLDNEAVNHFKTLYSKHFGDQKHFKIKLYFNVFIGVWIKSPSDSAKKCRDSIKHILLQNAEKYNPKQGFLSTKALTRWENLFIINKEAAGWNAKGIEQFVIEEKENRNSLLVEFIDENKKINALRKKFVNEYLLLMENNESNEAEEDALENYLTLLRQYALTKTKIYGYSLRWNKFI